MCNLKINKNLNNNKTIHLFKKTNNSLKIKNI